MYALRPATTKDLDILLALALEQGVRQASLAKTKEALLLNLERSQQAFQVASNEPHTIEQDLISNEPISPLFWVIIYQENVIGSIAIETNQGIKEPYYSYRRDTLINASYRLKVKQNIPVLYQSHELTRFVQLHSITLLPEHRNAQAISLVLQAPLLYVAEHSHLFTPTLLIEFPGFKDERGQSPLWNDLGQNFFQMTLEHACYHASIENKALIAQLMPDYPVYQNLLSRTCQSTLGEPQQDLLDYYQIMLKEGFKPSQHLDIFDGGPCLLATQKNLYSVQQNARLRSEQFKHHNIDEIVMNTDKSSPKALLLMAEQALSSATLNQHLACSNDTWLRVVPAHSGEGKL